MEKEKRIVLIGKCMAFNEKGEVLMVKRYRPWHEDSHEKWELPGGKVEFGEHPRETCERECLEESGYVVKATELIPDIYSHVWEHEDRDSNVVVFCYKADKIGGQASTEDDGVSDVRWFDLDELPLEEECIPGTIEFFEVIEDATK